MRVVAASQLTLELQGDVRHRYLPIMRQLIGPHLLMPSPLEGPG